MALADGVLGHGPTSWACAIRYQDGRVEVASAEKTLRSAEIESPLLRAPARIVEALAVLPAIGRRLPEAELPFRQGRVLAAMGGSLLVARALRASRLSPLAQETAAALI